MNSRSDTPCFNCNNRQMGCHSSCDLYLKWKAVKDKERKDRYEAIMKEEAIRTVHIAKWKNRKKKR